MANASKASASLLSRFQGALVGAVAGDCLGANFECDIHVNVQAVEKFFLNVNNLKEKQVFTDDTAMARSVANSLINKQGLDTHDMATRFVDEFHIEPDRGYGANIGNVFQALKKSNCADVFGPASQQFDGQGSYGNGAAMRIAPAALYGLHMSDENLYKLVTDVSRITHSHRDAISGAILQCLSVCQALRVEQGALVPEAFVDEVLKHMKVLEKDEDDGPPKAKRRPKRLSEEQPKPYCYKLLKIKEFLKEEDVSRETVEATLGNDISALGSAPTALYSFLRGLKPIYDLKFDNELERTICYAVSLGGDTDTIATMAGAMAGAYYGIEKVPEQWLKICEGVDVAKIQAEQLFDIVNKMDRETDAVK